MNSTTLKIGSHSIEVTHPERLLFPDDRITKEEFVLYHEQIAEFMVPPMQDRALTLFRTHSDILNGGFYQQKIPNRAPAWISRVTVKKEGGTVTHAICNDAASLVYLANQNCVTFHLWLSRQDQLEIPDQVIFDLDPSGNDFSQVVEGAFLLKDLLTESGLLPFVKTTGSHGLHVVVPLQRSAGVTFNEARAFAQAMANRMLQREPEKYTTEQRKDKRQGRLFIDTLRNSYAHTAVAPYSVRDRRGAPVAAPLFWEELSEKGLTAQSYNIRNILEERKKNGDPWQDFEKSARPLPNEKSQTKKNRK